MAIDVNRCVEQIRERGFCLLTGHFPADAIAACREAFEPILREHVAANADRPNRGPARHYINLPLHPPFFERRLLFDPDVLAVAEAILGHDMTLPQYATDTPMKGSVHQDVHSDLPLLFPEEPDHMHPPTVLAVNFPLVRITRDNGPFEIAAGTHRLPREDALQRIREGQIPLEPLYMEIGDVMIRDPRCLHRGSPNATDEPRVMVVIGFERGWLHREQVGREPVPPEIWESLNDRERTLLRKMPRAQA
jgi:ectoine hydroxylase-related dioxygenase (phytanoyl-CoA dioxygenase family)